MTEFETATLALQQGQLWAALAIPAVAGLVGIGQCWLIWIGIQRMGQASDQRAAREDARHVEAMTRMDQQGEALRALVAGLEQQGEALREQGAALERHGRALEAALTGGRA